MNSRLLNKSGDARTFAVILQTGDEVIRNLTKFAEEQHLSGSQFGAIGAFSSCILAWFDWEAREYRKTPVDEQVEVLSLIGDIAESDGKPKVHAHVVVGKRDGTAHGGHLMEARVRPTLEVVLTELPAHLRRKMDPASGIPLISL